jgi:DNA-binding LytR/AlgR family response regulator
MIRYVIVDDEPIAHGIIEKYAKEISSLQKIGNCYDAFQAMELLRKEQVDLLFLDINMPKLSGFEMLSTLKNPPKVIVTSAYKEFALEGYELQVFDYLLKPFSYARFLKAINTLLETTTHYKVASEVTPDYTVVKVDKKKYHVKFEDINYIEAQGNYSKVVTNSGNLLTLKKISDFEKDLPNQFIRVHNSFIINKHKITATEGNRIFIGEQFIPLGRTYKKNFQ